jgi:hypothetical protein
MAIDVLTVGEGQAYPLAYGEHVVSGHLLVRKTTAPVTVLIALGIGVWDKIETLWYKGEALPMESYHFHPGIPSSGLTDPVQGVDPWLPGGLTYSGIANIVVQLADENPDVAQLVGRYKCLVIDDYDANGNVTGSSSSSNPARVAADLMLKRGKRSGSRINWASWKRWRDACEEVITWNDGTTIHSIPRFTANVAFTQAVTLQSALNLLCDLSASNWQDDGREIRFITPFERTPVYQFSADNLIPGSIQVDQLDQREAPNRVVIQFRNAQNDFLAPASWTVEVESEIEQRGIVDLGTINYGPMTYSQAQRIGKYLLRVQGGSSTRAVLEALPESYSVLPADTVGITHALLSDTTREALVLESSDQLSGAGTRRFVAAILKEPLYADADHEPIPKNLEVIA